MAVVQADSRRLTRDPFLLFCVGYPWLLALVLRQLLPWLDQRLDQVALVDYYPIAGCLVAVLVPDVMGIVLGFQLLEEKDEASLVAVSVTPMSLDQYFLYRTTVYALASLPLVVVLHELLGLVSVSFGQLLLVGVAALFTVPFQALIIAAFAGNQVEGFAVMKGSGAFMLGPLAAFFIAHPWDLLIGILPTYWPIKAYFAAAAGQHGLFWAAIFVSLVYPVPWIVVLYRLFRRRAMAG